MGKKGFFITIEGCEGVGKSTQVKLLQEYFLKEKADAVFTREPGGTEVAEKIRKVILDKNTENMDGGTELLLYCAARRQHVTNKIIPLVKSGKIVVCDRFTDSTLAYQGYARGIDKDKIKLLNEFACAGQKIDLTLFLDLDPISGFMRKGGADKNDRLESEDIAFHKKVYEGFKEIAENNKDRVVRIDSRSSAQKVHRDIVGVLKARNIL